MAIGATYPLCFEMTIKGQVHLITALRQSVFGVFLSHAGGFRVGLAFKQDDPQRTALIESLAGKRPIPSATGEEETAASVGQ